MILHQQGCKMLKGSFRVSALLVVGSLVAMPKSGAAEVAPAVEVVMTLCLGTSSQTTKSGTGKAEADATFRYVEISARPLSRAQINAIKECPSSEDELIGNFRRFDNPRPTGRSDDTRFVSAWFDGDQNQGSGPAAEAFCKKRGLEVGRHKTARLNLGERQGLRLGDNSTCSETCWVFTSIWCQ